MRRTRYTIYTLYGIICHVVSLLSPRMVEKKQRLLSLAWSCNFFASFGADIYTPPPPPQTPHRIPRWTIEILAFNISVKHASPPSNALTSKDERWWVHSTNMGHSCRKKSILVWRPCTKKHLGYRYTQIGSDKHKASKELWIVAFLWRRPWKIWGNSANSLPPTGKKHHPVQALDPQKKHKGVHT